MKIRRVVASPPCLAADIIETWARTRPDLLPLREGAQHPGASRDLLPRERLFGHVIASSVIGWNLVVIDLARSPGLSWSLFAISALAATLLVHSAVHFLRQSGKFGRGTAHQVAPRSPARTMER